VKKVEKDDLIQVIYNHNEYLIESIEQVKKDIAYQNDLLKINEKHNKSTIETENEIEKLETKLETLEIIKEGFDDELNDNDVDMEEITKHCK
jgi:hypothetical protein